MEADAGGPVVMDPFVVGTDRIRGVGLLDVIGSSAFAAPSLGSTLGVGPNSLTSLTGGANYGTGGPNIRIGGREVIGRSDIEGSNTTMVRDPFTGEVTPLPSGVIDLGTTPTGLTQGSADLSDRIQQAIATRESVLGRRLTDKERTDLVNVVFDANTTPGRNLDLSPQTGGQGPGQFGIGGIIPLPVSPGVAAGLTIAGALLGGAGGGSTASSGTSTAGTGTSSGTTGTQPQTTETTQASGSQTAGSGTQTSASSSGSSQEAPSRLSRTTLPVGTKSPDGRLEVSPEGVWEYPANIRGNAPNPNSPEDARAGYVTVLPAGTRSRDGNLIVGPNGVWTPTGGGNFNEGARVPDWLILGTGLPGSGSGAGAGAGGVGAGAGAGGGVGAGAGSRTGTGGGDGPSGGGGGSTPFFVGTGSTGSGGQSGGNISFTINPAVATPITVRDPGLNRDLLREGRISAPALKETAGSTVSSYGTLGGQPGQYDIEAFQNLIGNIAAYTPELTRIATEQTISSNRALRDANISDVQRLGQAAMEAQRAANPELYSTLGTYLPAATGMLATDLERLQGAGRLSAEEVRTAQQAAREGSVARGRDMDMSGIAAEVLNRDAYSRQRQAEARANVQQSMQNVYGGIGAAQAATFNPFAALLGQQYGMQTSNVGQNQALFGQGSAFSSGGLSNQFVQGLLNPYSPYAADVYGSNFNAANARAIQEAMANAAAQGANQQLIGGLAGLTLNYAIPEFLNIFNPRR